MIIELKYNQWYANFKVLNLFIIGISYALAAVGMDVINNFFGSKNLQIIEMFAYSFLAIQVMSFCFCVGQFVFFKKIMYPLLTTFTSDEEYIKDVLKYRKNTYTYLYAQILIVVLLSSWFGLIAWHPETVLLYPVPKISIILIFGYILVFLSIDSDLDSIYWRYFNREFRKYINKVFKKN